MDSTETKDERKYNKESAETKEKKGAKNETKNKKAKQKIWAGREKERERENWRCGVQQLRDFQNPTNILSSCTFRYVVVILPTVLSFHTMDLPEFHLYSWNSLIARGIIQSNYYYFWHRQPEEEIHYKKMGSFRPTLAGQSRSKFF